MKLLIGLVTAVLCIIQQSLEHEIPRRSFLSRRAIDGTRGRKYFDPNEDGAFDSYGSAGGQYDPYDHITDLSDIRKNVPGEPGIDYPAYTTLPQTGFTCEGRSRYYADEAAGCQVFHVCHDVLVSSFLCPIGSTFSQKLLTCDWWTKVDCASTRRYLEVNRNNYQIDDDEMIRNAYAMISLQTSAEDVTKDGLVDPDSGARIIDYSALGGRIVMGYTPGFRRITDYAAVETTGNDLPSGFEDYPHQDARQILNYDLHYPQKKTSTAYQSKLRLENKGRSPYHASPIIRHDYQDRPGDNVFQNHYRRPDGFTDRLQASYAPTVPTVTTTTRRLYSPTVPTTYRPSTLAYSKLDLMVDSSDHLYAQSKSLVTPPTIIHQDDDMRKIDLRESETGHGGLKKSENVSSSRTDKNDQEGDNARSKNDKVHLDVEETSETSFRINVTDAIDEDEVFRQQNDRPIIQSDSEDSSEVIEVEDSIGIARALNNPSDRIIIQSQNPIHQVSKDKRKDLAELISSQTVFNHSSGSYEKAGDVNSADILKKSEAFNETSNDRSTEDYEDISSSTTRSFGDRTTPLLRNWQQKNADDVQASMVSMTTILVINTTSDEISEKITVRSSSNDSYVAMDQKSSPTGSISSFNDEAVPRLKLSFEVPQPAQFLKPPLEPFLINVLEGTRYTTIDENSKISWSPTTTTTEIPQFTSTLPKTNEDQSPIYDENVEEQSLIDYADENITPSLGVHSTAPVVTEASTSIPGLISTWHDRTIVDVPVTDIVPPIVDYNDGFGDFVPPDERPYTEQFDHTEPADSRRTQSSSTTLKNNDSETEFLARFNTGFQFTIRDAIKAQEKLKGNSKSSCHSSSSDKQEGRCETSSATPKITVSPPSVKDRIVSINTKVTTKIPEQSTFSSSIKSLRSPEESMTPLPKEYQTSTEISVKSSIISNVNSNVNSNDTEELKTVTPRDVLQVTNPKDDVEKTVETTANSLLHSNRPGSLKQIEEAIDKHDSPYEVSFTVKKDDLETTADDFISRLIARHQQSSFLNDELGDFEIIKSVEPETEVASILQTPKFPDTSHTSLNNANNNSFHTVDKDTVNQNEQSNSNVSMVGLLQLMAELLKLDRLPRPFSTKDLRSIELKDSFNLDLDKSSYVTTNSRLDHLQDRTPYKNENFKASTFDTFKIPATFAESKTSRNLRLDEPSITTASPLSDHLQAGTPFGTEDSEISSLDDTSKISIDLDFKPPPDVSSRVNFNNTAEQKTSQSKSESGIARPLQKEEILEQLTENLGQPLYRDDSIRRLPIFDLPQVQRSLDFESGLPIEDSKHATEEGSETREQSEIEEESETEEGSANEEENFKFVTTTQKTTTTTTTESTKTIVETEFVPSLGFSLDTDEGREEYVQAVLEGLIDDHTVESAKNETNIVQDRVLKNETLEAEQ
ncbi:hypothetical protein P5V15_003867 [Pogonomyrmex californicus]